MKISNILVAFTEGVRLSFRRSKTAENVANYALPKDKDARRLQAINQDNLYDAVWAYAVDPGEAEDKYGPISEWDVSGVTDMSYLFHELTDFNADLSAWDVSNVQDMRSMFEVSKRFVSDVS
eukprot:411950_1